MQLVIEFDPSITEYFPVPQFVQSESFSFFVVVEYVPAGQFLQPSIDPETSLYNPAMQSLQSPTTVVSVESPQVPLGQGAHRSLRNVPSDEGTSLV